MRTMPWLTVALLLSTAGCPSPKGVATGPGEPVKRRRGLAPAEHGRPERFPHRIWAACDFEARPHNFGWFGGSETKNIPPYPGNAAARRGTPLKKWAAVKTGMNPVPGPRMGKVNKLYVRYWLKGADEIRLQHYSLSSGDNCNVLVTGLKQGRWAETVVNFTRDSRRNDGSPGAFKQGERMDDLQVYVGKPDDGKDYQVVIDDPILFAEDPALPPEPEPFPQRVMFLAAFDTGIDAKSRPSYFPGRFEPASGAKAPRGAYWVVARAVDATGGRSRQVLLEMKPPRTAGARTKVRFRYWVKGASKIKVVLHDATAGASRAADVADCKQQQWVTQYVSFDASGGLSAGNKIDSVAFSVPAGKDVELYVDEVVLFDAGKPLKR